MTEQKILVYKLFLSLKKSQPFLKKVTTLFPSNLPLKIEALSRPLFENLVGGSISPHPSRKSGVGGGGGGGGSHYVKGLENMLLLLLQPISNSYQHLNLHLYKKRRVGDGFFGYMNWVLGWICEFSK